jgi:hypothetical protein
MSKKRLLEESTIRSFMKLANLQPLTNKFLKESDDKDADDTEKGEEAEEDDEEEKEKMEESAPPDTEETAHSRDRLEEEEEQDESESLEEEVVEEEGEVTEEGKESEGRPASPKPKVKGVAKPGKMDAAKHARKDDKLKALSAGTHHSDRDDTIDTKGHSNAPKKNNSQFELHESLEEEMDEEAEAPESPEMAGGDDMGSAGESGDHKDKMKALLRDMLGKLSEMGQEYGMSMEISDEGGGDEAAAPETEAPPEAGAEMPPEKIEKLTSRVAARLVKQSKKKR